MTRTETRLGNGVIRLWSGDHTPAIPERTPCPTCGEPLRFVIEHIYGRTFEECRCGVRALGTTPVAAVVIPPEMIGRRESTGPAPARTEPRICAVCGVTFQARIGWNAKGCSRRCKNTLWRRAEDRQAYMAQHYQKIKDRKQEQRNAFLAQGLTTRGTPRKRGVRAA